MNLFIKSIVVWLVLCVVLTTLQHYLSLLMFGEPKPPITKLSKKHYNGILKVNLLENISL